MHANNMINTALQQNNLTLEPSQIEQLSDFIDLMQTWNKVFNLTSITDTKEMVYLHLIDSLIIQPYLQGKHIIDIGTGAGLPGMPLAIANPDKHFTLLDKNSKKTRFMTQATADLGLNNVKVVHSRSEDFHPAQGFDSILSRALSSLNDFCQSTLHLLAKNGCWLAMKGRHPQQEIAQLDSQLMVQNALKLDVKGINVERHLICISKQSV